MRKLISSFIVFIAFAFAFSAVSFAADVPRETPGYNQDFSQIEQFGDNSVNPLLVDEIAGLVFAPMMGDLMLDGSNGDLLLDINPEIGYLFPIYDDIDVQPEVPIAKGVVLF